MLFKKKKLCVPTPDCFLCTGIGSRCDEAHHADTLSKQEQQPWNTAVEGTLTLVEGGQKKAKGKRRATAS